MEMGVIEKPWSSAVLSQPGDSGYPLLELVDKHDQMIQKETSVTKAWVGKFVGRFFASSGVERDQSSIVLPISVSKRCGRELV